jgi:hypothetical protein
MAKRKKDKQNIIKALSMIAYFGLNMLVPIFMCTFLGIYIGEKTDINWLVIPFFFLGAISGGVNIYKISKTFFKY